MKRLFTYILCLIFYLFIGCKKDSNAPIQLSKRYQLSSVISDKPLDLNFDGVKNIDLKEEIPTLKGEKSLMIDTSMSSVFIDIFWVEPRTNNDPLLSTPIDDYREISSIEYLTISNPLYYKLDNNKLLFLRRVNTNHMMNYTFTPPHQITIQESGKKLSFKTSQRYLTSEGIQSANITIEYIESKISK